MGPLQYKRGWFWAITIANAAACALLIALIYLILSVLAAFAAGVEEWPFFVLFGLFAAGIALSVISWPLTRAAPTRSKRWIGYGVNGSALSIYLLFFVGIAIIWLQTTRRLFLVPAGFQGDLYVVHDSNPTRKQPNGFGRTTYLFPKDGVLETPDPAPTAFSDEYRYVYPDGHSLKLNDAGPGTLQDTPENRTSTTEVVTYFGRSLQPNGPSDCYVEEISIGTRAFLLSKRPVSQPPEVTHPGICH
jgi:hypothetical protein